ncbi:MAG: hypothetical protein ACAH80_05585 [Alphaproteobacteria bacterium]
MPIGQKISSFFRNAFIRATHFESAADFDRKDEVMGRVLALSKAVTDTSAEGYEDRLKETLKQTRTRHLDVLAEKQVAVALDNRFAKQQIDDREMSVDGMFYVGPQQAALGGLATLRDGKGEQARVNSIFLERLAEVLSEVTPVMDLHAYSFTTVAMGGDGMACWVNNHKWAVEGEGAAHALAQNPQLRKPPLKQAPAAKPN